MLRAVSDGVMLGAGTMNAEADYTCHVFDQDMEDMRIANGKNPVPWNIITSLDATDIPFGHILFNTPEVPVMISTSRKGMELVRENLKNEAYFVDAPSMEAVTEELIQGMKENADKVLVIGTGDTAPDSKAVSYTHLDVYKRQLGWCTWWQGLGWWPRACCSASPKRRRRPPRARCTITVISPWKAGRAT